LPVFFLSGCAVVFSLHLLFVCFFLCSCDTSLIKIILFYCIFQNNSTLPSLIMEILSARYEADCHGVLLPWHRYRLDVLRMVGKHYPHSYVKAASPHMIWSFWRACHAPRPHIITPHLYSRQPRHMIWEGIVKPL
jgi:hypothetical protein